MRGVAEEVEVGGANSFTHSCILESRQRWNGSMTEWNMATAINTMALVT